MSLDTSRTTKYRLFSYVCSSERWYSHKPPVVRLRVKLNSFGVAGLHVEAQGIGSVIVPIAGICPQCTSEYQAFVDEVNDVLLRVLPTESTALMGDFNAHVGTDAATWKGVIGKHGVTELNENGRYLLQFCCSNGLRIMNIFFSTGRFTSMHGIELEWIKSL